MMYATFTTAKQWFQVMLFVVVLSSYALSAIAQPAPTINYQGKLTDSAGAAVADGTYNMRFWLFQNTSQATTSAIWTEELTGANQVDVVNGLFSVMLGSTSPLTSVDFNQTLYLGVEVGGTGSPAWDGEMLPRKPLGTVPAAFESFQLGGVASSSFVRSDEADTIAATTASTLLTINQSGAGDILNLLDGGAEVFSIMDGGVVGIGTSSADRLLNVAGATDAGARFTDETNGVAVDIRAEDFQGFIGTVSNNDLRLVTNNTSRLTIDTGGDIGVGTTTPASKLDVWGDLRVGTNATGTLVVDTTNDQVLIPFGSSANPGLAFIADADTGFAHDYDGAFQYISNGVVRLSFDPNSLYGAVSGGASLNLAGGSESDPTYKFVGDSDTGLFASVADTLGFSTGGTERLRIGANGNVAIGTSTMSENSRLTIAGTTTFIGDTSVTYNFNNGQSPSSAATRIGIDANGNGLVIKEGSGNNAGTYLGIYNRFGSQRFVVTESGSQFYNGRLFSDDGFSTGGNLSAVSDISSFNSTASSSPAMLVVDGRSMNDVLTDPRTIPLMRFARYSDGGISTPTRENSFGGITGVETATTRGLNFSTYSSSTDTFVDTMTLLSTGNVGIGTTSPYAKLSVAGDLALTGGIYDNTASLGTNGMVMQTTGSGVQWVATSSLGFAAAGTESLFTDDGTTTYLTSLTDNVGIGTTTSTAKLSVAGDINIADNNSGILVNGDRAFHASTTQNNYLIGNSGANITTGAGNLLFGNFAGNSLTDGSTNIFMGFNAGASVVSNAFNIFIGETAGDALSDGLSNVAIGVNAASDLVSGSRNIFLGQNAGQNFATTSDSVLIGYGAGGAGTPGNAGGINVVAIGHNAGGALTNGFGSTLIGYGAGDNITSGINNLVIGYDVDAPSATDSNQLNIGNIIFGTGVDGTGTTLSSGNVGIGTTTPNAKLTVVGDINISDNNSGYSLLGNRVLYASSTNNSTLGGFSAGQSLLSDGTDNTAFGFEALTTATSSDNNTAFGSQALRANRGSRNTAVGALALYLQTTGRDNTAVGFDAMFSQTTGRENTAVGSQALRRLVGGWENTAVGYNALNGAGFTGGANTALGHSVFDNLTGGSDYNIGIGVRTGTELESGSRNILIGYDVELTSTSTSRNLNIGNLIFGTDLDGTGTTLSSGNVGIGTSSPASKLDVWGNFRVGTSSISTLFVDSSTNQVGIGTTSPSAKLSVAGGIGLGGDFIPSANLTYDIGSSSNRFANVWAETLNVGTSTWSIYNGTDGRLAFSNADQQSGTEIFSIGTVFGTPTGPFDVSTASFVDNEDVSGQEAFPWGLAFSNDGLKMFVVGSGADDVEEYTLSTAFDVSTASHVDDFPITQDSFPRGLAFSNDGFTMFVVGGQNNRVHEYSLSTAFDVSTASHVDFLSVISGAVDVSFSDDGFEMFVVSQTGMDVNTYTLSTAFDVSTGSFDSDFDVSSQDTAPVALEFSNDGLKLFVVGDTGEDINEYTLDSAYNLATTTFIDSYNVSAQGADPRGLAFSNDGFTMLVVDLTDAEVNEYTLGTRPETGRFTLDGDLDLSGSIGIGTTSPSSKLDVWGDFRVGTSGTPAFMVDTSADQVLVASGTVSTPGLAFINDTDTGLMLDAADTIAFITNGSYEMLLDGVALYGSTGGSFSLSTLNGGASQPTYAFNGNGDMGMYRATQDELAFSTLSTERLRIDSSGNVGIGTTSPSSKLDVWGDFRVGTSSTPTLFVDTAANWLGIGTTTLANTGMLTMTVNSFTTSQSPRITLNEEGVGSSDSGAIFFTRNSPSNGRVVGNIDFDNQAAITAYYGSGAVEGNLRFSTNDPGAGPALTEKMRLTADGSLGIGTTAPSSKLTVAGDILIEGVSSAGNATTSYEFTEVFEGGSDGPGSYNELVSMATYDGDLFFGTGTGVNDGDLFRWDGATTTFVYSTGQERVQTMATYDNKLYFGLGSGEGDAALYTYDAVTATTTEVVTGIASRNYVTEIETFNGRLYYSVAGSFSQVDEAEVYVLDSGGLSSTVVHDPNDNDYRSVELHVFNGQMYAAYSEFDTADDEEEVHVYVTDDGTNWELYGVIDGSSDATPNAFVRDMVTYNGEIYLSTGGVSATDGRIYNLSLIDPADGADDSDNAAVIAVAPDITDVEGIYIMQVFDGKLFYGTGNSFASNGDIYAYNGISSARVYDASSVDSSLVLGTYNGSLYAGFGSSAADGDLLQMTTAPTATSSYGLTFATDDGLGKNATGTLWFEARDILGGYFDDNSGDLVAGTFMMSHSLITNAGAYDVAEDYPTNDADLEVGMIMEFDSNNPGGITRATNRASIAGVTSGDPGFLLSQQDRAGMVPMALVGRVPVKVTNDNGSIAVGDSITLSDSTAGYGMAANWGDKAVGYAIEATNFNNATTTLETDEVLVYVALHTALGDTPDLDGIEGEVGIDSENLFDRLRELAAGFVDGVLSITGINVDSVTTEQLCVGGTCVDENQLKRLLEQGVISDSSDTDTEDESDTTSGNEGSDESGGGNGDPEEAETEDTATSTDQNNSDNNDVDVNTASSTDNQTGTTTTEIDNDVEEVVMASSSEDAVVEENQSSTEDAQTAEIDSENTNDPVAVEPEPIVENSSDPDPPPESDTESQEIIEESVDGEASG